MGPAAAMSAVIQMMMGVSSLCSTGTPGPGFLTLTGKRGLDGARSFCPVPAGHRTHARRILESRATMAILAQSNDRIYP